MERAFETPICVKSGDVHATIREIKTAQDASGFLTDWPAAKRTTLSYRDASATCAAATESDSARDTARDAFLGFAKDMDILVRC